MHERYTYTATIICIYILLIYLERSVGLILIFFLKEMEPPTKKRRVSSITKQKSITSFFQAATSEFKSNANTTCTSVDVETVPSTSKATTNKDISDCVLKKFPIENASDVPENANYCQWYRGCKVDVSWLKSHFPLESVKLGKKKGVKCVTLRQSR